MEALLDLLYAEYDRESAMRQLRDETARTSAIETVAPRLAAGLPSGFLASEAGTNLYVAVLTLRVKFSHEEASQKVRLNIAMRYSTTTSASSTRIIELAQASFGPRVSGLRMTSVGFSCDLH